MEGEAEREGEVEVEGEAEREGEAEVEGECAGRTKGQGCQVARAPRLLL